MTGRIDRLGGLLLGLWAAVSGAQDAAAQDIAYVKDQVCAECHEAQYDRWLGSHHRHAMAPADPANVQGDFDDASFTHKGKTTRFFRKDGGYFVATEGPDGAPGDFQVRYTFGYHPLQQYLLAMPGGRLQALDVAWDSEAKRWFPPAAGPGLGPRRRLALDGVLLHLEHHLRRLPLDRPEERLRSRAGQLHHHLGRDQRGLPSLPRPGRNPYDLGPRRCCK